MKTTYILFVDDNEITVEFAREVFKEFEYKGIFLTDSLKALEIIRNDPNKFDLIITDYEMPKMNGEILAKEVRKVCNNLPIIIATGNTQISREDISQWGVDELIIKPYQAEEMNYVIQQLLKRYNSDLKIHA
ncbi:MAG: CheY-like chemotaxis protein [bacterium]|jgi:CheY-like chemotaxis protein